MAPSVDEVQPITGQQERFHHTAKHLYCPAEHWEQVVADLGDAFGAACTAGCPARLLREEAPAAYRAGQACREHVFRDHDSRYAPVYMAELRVALEDGRYGPLYSEPGVTALVGGEGVFILIGRTRPKGWRQVKTAYRVASPLYLQGPATRENFFRAAVRRLKDKTSWTDGEG